MNWNLHPIEQFEQLAPAWNALNVALGSPPFLHSRFILPLCRTFGDPELKIAVCENVQGPLAIGILARQGSRTMGDLSAVAAAARRVGHASGSGIRGPVVDPGQHTAGAALAIGITQQDPDCIARPAESPL